MKLYLEFEPCEECRLFIKELVEVRGFSDADKEENESAKFLRHLIYNHQDVLRKITQELPLQKRRQEYDWYR
ncbi:MAG TPA: hypothetical protein VD699_04720 [Nitrosopumilaceae archaeon]|nr:hypothetical protein [Nitrosopumilaceae archaeon]